MALNTPIIITPQDIYDYDNQKVINNEVDYIEVQSSVPQLISDTQNVYNEDIKNLPLISGNTKDELTGLGSESTIIGSTISSSASCLYGKISSQYINKTIKINKTINNSRILRLLTGKNDLGEANIKYNIRGDILNGSQKATVTVKSLSSAVGGGDVETVRFENDFTLFAPTNVETTPSKIYTLDDKLTINEFYTYPEATVGDKLDISLPNNTNVISATAIEKDTYFEITLNILCALEKTVLFGGFKKSGAPPVGIELNGTYEKYIPTSITVSFYGDTISIDLQNETLTIGSGKNVISFGGNELIQSTNTYGEETRTINNPFSLTSSNLSQIIDDTPMYYGSTSITVPLQKGESIVGAELITLFENSSATYSGNTVNIVVYTPNPQQTVMGRVVVTINRPNAVIQTYQKVIEEWKDGKEIATIRCGINDYFDTEGSVAISPNDTARQQIVLKKYSFYPPMLEILNGVKASVGEKIKYEGRTLTIGGVLGEGKYIVINGSVINDVPTGTIMQGTILHTVPENTPMTMQIGDIVIPQVRTANGQAKPMSLYIDGSPKQFNIVGKKMIYDGGVWQQLTLQEKTQEES